MPDAASFDIDARCDELAKHGSEHAEQRAFFCWLNFAAYTQLVPLAGLCFAIPNGGKRDKVTAARLKAEGVKAGVPDIAFPVPCGSYIGLFMELKIDNNAPTELQAWWHGKLREQRHAVAVCWGWRKARECFLAYVTAQPVQREYR